MTATAVRRGRVSTGNGLHDNGPRPTDGKLRLVGYVRVSTDDQATNGVSLDAQRERIQAHAIAHACELVGIEHDEGVSGKVPPRKREGLGRALKAVDAGEADGLVFLKLDRLSRSVRDILEIAEEARRGGWHLVSVQESIDTSTAAGKMILTVLAALAEMEREQIGERTRMGMDQVAREGRARSSRLPFGYRVDGTDAITLTAGDVRSLVEHEGEQRILRRICQLVKAKMGARRIARDLNERGLINPRTHAPWNPFTVAGLLRTIRRRSRLETGPQGSVSNGSRVSQANP